MTKFPCRKAHLTAAATAALLLASAGASRPGVAQGGNEAADPPIPCAAFARNQYGGWKVLSPVTLDFGGTLLSFTVGTGFAAGATTHGLEMTTILDRNCGNLPTIDARNRAAH